MILHLVALAAQYPHALVGRRESLAEEGGDDEAQEGGRETAGDRQQITNLNLVSGYGG